MLHACSRAHNALFISELATQRERLPEGLRTPQGKGKAPARKRSGEAVSVEVGTDDGDSERESPAVKPRNAVRWKKKPLES